METIKRKPNGARERVLKKAERLFHRHGYQSVTMRDLAKSLGMKQASLYYHAPGGKEDLFAEVTERSLARHRRGLENAIAQAAPTLDARLNAAAKWLISQPPLHLFSMFEADMPALSEETAVRLQALAYDSLFAPLITLFRTARANGEMREFDPDRLAGAFLTLIDGVMYAHQAGHATAPLQELTDEMIDMMLHGLIPYPQGGSHS